MRTQEILEIRRKPIELEAIQLRRSEEINTLYFIHKPRTKDLLSVVFEVDRIIVEISEMGYSRTYSIRYGDYVIKDVDGKIYPPCNPDVFHQEYDVIHAFPFAKQIPKSFTKAMEETVL